MKLKVEQKQNIIEAAKNYIKLHEREGMSQNKLAERANVNPAYISALFKGNLNFGSAGKITEIKDSIFQKIATAIGYSLKKSYWDTVVTPQFQQMIVSLLEAKQSGRTCMIIGGTGAGKSFAITKFCTQHPMHTFRITVNNLYHLSDFLYEMLLQLGLDDKGSKARRLSRIGEKLREIKRQGGTPLLIIDEGENLKVPAFGMIKALYDVIKDYCSIALVGTPQLIDKLERYVMKNKDGIPQFYRRFKAGCRNLPEVDKRFTHFFENMTVDPGVKKLLLKLCDNYGELNDYLEPFLKEADTRGVDATEELFRLMYHIPKLKIA